MMSLSPIDIISMHFITLISQVQCLQWFGQQVLAGCGQGIQSVLSLNTTGVSLNKSLLLIGQSSVTTNTTALPLVRSQNTT